jgi:hypothetical protein
VVCEAQISWQFSICSGCEEKYGRRADEWPEWLRYLVNQSRRERRAHARDKSRIVQLDSNHDGFACMSVEELVIAKMEIAYYFTSDGDEVELMDSDWEAVYSYG